MRERGGARDGGADKQSPPDLPGGCTAGDDPAEMVCGMHRRTDADMLGAGTRVGKCRLQGTPCNAARNKREDAS